MQRRTFLGSLAGGLLAAAPTAKTNVVMILADDLGWSDLACYGNPYVSTPNLDRLAREGARFTQAYAACPVCSPTRASILTGQYPVRTGVTDWIPGRPSDPRGPVITPRTATELRLDAVTVPKVLKPSGYKSASMGKWHLGGNGFLPTDQGFDVNIGGNASGSPPQSGKPYFGPFQLPNLTASATDFLPEMLTDAATTFIERNRSEALTDVPAARGVGGGVCDAGGDERMRDADLFFDGGSFGQHADDYECEREFVSAVRLLSIRGGDSGRDGGSDGGDGIPKCERRFRCKVYGAVAGFGIGVGLF